MSVRVQRVVVPGGERTWTVLGADHRRVEPVEAFLEYLRVRALSPNTVKSYARALALWWEFLDLFDLVWDGVGVEDFGRFLGWLRSGDTPGVVSIESRQARFSERTIAVRLHAVSAFYRYHHFNGVDAASRLYDRVFAHGRSYRPFLEHLERRRGSVRSVVAPRPAPSRPAPTLTPAQIALVKDACAWWDAGRREWVGSLRDRLLWALLEETGMRIGEALGVQHRDWHTGRGDTPFVEVMPRAHPHGLRVKSGAYRRLFVSDELDRLYGDYLYALVEQGIDLAVDDLDGWWLFVNLAREPRFSPLRAETVAALVRRLRRQLAGRVPERWTPHWFRHTHATALLLAGTPLHVVSRRLGHRDVQTTQNLYAWVTEDAELRAVADWRRFTKGWRAGVADALTHSLPRGCAVTTASRSAKSYGGRSPSRCGSGASTPRQPTRTRRSRGGLRFATLIWERCPSRCDVSWHGACGARSSKAARSTARTPASSIASGTSRQTTALPAGSRRCR